MSRKAHTTIACGAGDRELATSNLVLFGSRIRDASLPSTSLARRWVDPPAWLSWLTHGRKAGAIANLTFYFDGSGSFSHAVC